MDAEQHLDPYPEEPSGRAEVHRRAVTQPGGDNRPLVTLELQGHSAIPLRCCDRPKPSPTQVSEWGETLTVYCANCSATLVQVVGPPVSVVNGG